MSRSHVILSAMALASAATLGCCRNDHCVEPPLLKQESDKSVAIDIAAKLDKLPLTADLKTEFKDTLNQEFNKLSDKNASLLMFLQAIDCYLKAGKAGEDLARQLFTLVRDWWAAIHDFRGLDNRISPAERAAIDESSFADQIYKYYKQFGVQ